MEELPAQVRILIRQVSASSEILRVVSRAARKTNESRQCLKLLPHSEHPRGESSNPWWDQAYRQKVQK
jgi:hypothetical protein